LHKNKTNVCYATKTKHYHLHCIADKRVKDVAMTCVLTAVSASKYLCSRTGAPPRTPLGKLTALPRPPIAGFGGGRKRGGEGSGGEGKERKVRKRGRERRGEERGKGQKDRPQAKNPGYSPELYATKNEQTKSQMIEMNVTDLVDIICRL